MKDQSINRVQKKIVRGGGFGSAASSSTWKEDAKSIGGLSSSTFDKGSVSFSGLKKRLVPKKSANGTLT